jgi:hypothetical protein
MMGKCVTSICLPVTGGGNNWCVQVWRINVISREQASKALYMTDGAEQWQHEFGRSAPGTWVIVSDTFLGSRQTFWKRFLSSGGAHCAPEDERLRNRGGVCIGWIRTSSSCWLVWVGQQGGDTSIAMVVAW